MQSFPYPSGEVFACGVLKAIDFVKVVMVESILYKFECFLDFAEVHNPAKVRIQWPLHVDFNSETMPMQSAALVTCGNVGQPMRSFNCK